MSTAIEWTDETWNPVTGCSKVSAGCANCYAEGIDKRFDGFGNGHKPWTAVNAEHNVTMHPVRLGKPLSWKKPRRVFVNSMSDLFHEQVPFEFIGQVFDIMWQCGDHKFQVLTKRPARMLEFVKWWIKSYEDAGLTEDLGPWQPPKNIWLGVSVENQQAADERIPLLLQTPAAVRFLSCEPLLGPVDIRHQLGQCVFTEADQWATGRGIDWVIVGGESGSGARPIHPEWVRSLRDQCDAKGVPFFFKQWGEWVPADHHDGVAKYSTVRRSLEEGAPFMYRVGKKAAGRLLDGREWNEMPEVGRP
ncbi:phage Gp37/Gp68 family protein [Tumebacillus sp. DT12]|uniref:Phage Gp37/Gp68 family protein n=1 Tax=Tumebacillus lacus TaxID=2995335 RepID=A0ABT3X329_9BACL|nr:phage Gp37/Gp68 family protein [Tumebacillus lacus]MCX7570372.1 phage Gp37/Gp68 family protein [Tumebacillus lacus]